MFFSKYNIIEKFEDKTIIYNTLSTGILNLNKDYSSHLDKMITHGIFEKKDLVNELMKGGMLYKEYIDELAFININSIKSRFNELSAIYTIAPTMECNFKCDYCFEQGKRYNTMSDKVISDTIDFIVENSIHTNSVDITWYGGEPLIAIDMIEKITNEVLKRLNNNIKYNAGIVTNGFLLSKENAILLKKLGITRTQITLDGSMSTHDQRRPLLSGKGTYSKIMKNIEECCDILDIVIRINVDKRNSDEYIEILNELENLKIQNKVDVYIAPVESINDIASNKTCFNEKEFGQKQLEFLKVLKEKNIKIKNKISTNLSICGAVSANSFLIDPLGDIYKCWNDVSNKMKSIGNISDKSIINNEHIKWLNYNPINKQECKECKLLPICMGGCPYKSLNSSSLQCSVQKYNLRNKLEMLVNA